MDYVSASQLMFAEIGFRDPGQHDAWTHHAPEIAHARESGLVDAAVSRELLVRAESSTPIVFDSWTLPYMARESASLRKAVFFLKLDSDINSRAVRCLVSQGADAKYSITEAVNLIRSKDLSSRERFKSLFGFDILGRENTPRGARKARVDVSRFVFGSSPQQVRRGIQSAHHHILENIPHARQTVS